MGLFEKKFCSICGDKIGLLGNRKLEDGNCCKACAAKLSPWFSDRKNSTVAEIKEQLAYREANKAEVAAFHTTRALGTGVKVLLDEDAHKFMVTSATKLEDANPDVMSFADVAGCSITVDENKTEVKRKDNDGKMVSYTPPHYQYAYSFYCTINVNNPYFNEIRFRIHNNTIEIGGINGTTITPDPLKNVEYKNTQILGTEIKNALTQVRQQVRRDAAPKKAVICQCCGATTIPDSSGCCEYCGGSVNG